MRNLCWFSVLLTLLAGCSTIPSSEQIGRVQRNDKTSLIELQLRSYSIGKKYYFKEVIAEHPEKVFYWSISYEKDDSRLVLKSFKENGDLLGAQFFEATGDKISPAWTGEVYDNGAVAYRFTSNYELTNDVYIIRNDDPKMENYFAEEFVKEVSKTYYDAIYTCTWKSKDGVEGQTYERTRYYFSPVPGSVCSEGFDKYRHLVSTSWLVSIEDVTK